MRDPEILKLTKSLEYYRKMYAELAQLAGELAHEIKNPLSIIHMNMDMLAEDFTEATNRRDRRTQTTIETVKDQCLRLENLLNDFLRFSKQSQINLIPGDLNAQIERVLALYLPQAEQSGITVLRYLDPDLPMILLSSESLQAALVNLVKNSLEAMDGKRGELTVRTRTTLNGVALDLIDTGSGMDQQTALNMFEPFYTTKQGGSGLGLPTARKIIEAHGGRIDVQSSEGQGTQFTLEFPVPPRLAPAE
ncbi:MAG: ATP-binding protein [Pirellulaceae bacterium]|nr:ATP-binding protein [Pirellulaceae bacterium]